MWERTRNIGEHVREENLCLHFDLLPEHVGFRFDGIAQTRIERPILHGEMIHQGRDHRCRAATIRRTRAREKEAAKQASTLLRISHDRYALSNRRLAGPSDAREPVDGLRGRIRHPLSDLSQKLDTRCFQTWRRGVEIIVQTRKCGLETIDKQSSLNLVDLPLRAQSSYSLRTSQHMG
jgi:hypothetical protein